MDKIFQKVMTYGVAVFFFITLFWIVSENPQNIWHTEAMGDERTYLDISHNFTVEYIKYIYDGKWETKPITFLALGKLFESDVVYTRIFNIILVIINTFLIYKLTKNRLSFIYPIFPIFLNSMWFTDETIEMSFILVGICYKERAGIMYGLATLFRPYALLYSVFLSKKHIMQVLIMGVLFSILLLYLGLFFPYLNELTHYTKIPNAEIDALAFLMLVIFFLIGCRNKLMLQYAIIAAIPLYVRQFAHYFLPVYTFLFIGFLLTMNEDFNKIKKT